MTRVGLSMSTNWKTTSYNLIFVIINRLTCWEDFSIDYATALRWRGTNYDLILVVIDRFKKLLRDKPV